MTPSDLIKTLRKLSGLPHRKWIRKTGISPARLSEWETGKVNPRLDNVLHICESTGIEIVLKKKESSEYIIGCDVAAEGTSDYSVVYKR